MFNTHKTEEQKESLDSSSPQQQQISISSHMYRYFWTGKNDKQSDSDKQIKEYANWIKHEKTKGAKMMNRVSSLTVNDSALPEAIAKLSTCPPPTRRNPQLLLSGYLAVKTTTSWSSKWNCRYVVLTPHYLYVFKRAPPAPGQHAHAQILPLVHGTSNSHGINQSSGLEDDLYISHPSHDQHSSMAIFGEIRDTIPVDITLAVLDAGDLFFQVSHPSNLRIIFRTLNPRHTALWKGAIRTAIILSKHSIQTFLTSLPEAYESQMQMLQQAKEKHRKLQESASTLESEKSIIDLHGILSDPAFGTIPHVDSLLPAYADRSSLISSVSAAFSHISMNDLATTGLISNPFSFVSSQSKDALYPEVVLERNINWGEEIVVPIPQCLVDKINKGSNASNMESIVVTFQDGGSVVLDVSYLYKQALQAQEQHAKGSSAESNATVISNFPFADGVFPVQDSFYNSSMHLAWRFVPSKPKTEDTPGSPTITKSVSEHPTLSNISSPSTVNVNVDPTVNYPQLFKPIKRGSNLYKSEISFTSFIGLLVSIFFTVSFQRTLYPQLPGMEQLLANLSKDLHTSYSNILTTLSPVVTYILGCIICAILVIYTSSNLLQTVLNPFAKRPNKYIQAQSISNTAPIATQPVVTKEQHIREQRVPLSSLPQLRLVFVRLVDNQSPTGPVLLNGVPFENKSWPVLPSTINELIPATAAVHGLIEDASEPSPSLTGQNSTPGNESYSKRFQHVRRRRVQPTDIIFGESANVNFANFVDQGESDELFPTDFSDSEEDEDTTHEADGTMADTGIPLPDQTLHSVEDATILRIDPELGKVVETSWGRWCQSDHTPLKLRGMDYLTNKKKLKIPATQHRFEVANSIIIAVIKSFSNAASRPESYFNKEKAIMASRGKGAQWSKGTPLKFFIVTWIVPGEPNYNYVTYFRNPYIYPWPYSDEPSTPHAIAVQASIKQAIEAGEAVLNERYNIEGNEHCKAYYPKNDPFFLLMKRFLEGTNEFRTSRFKYIPNIVTGPWVVRKAAGQTPCILGNKLAQRYYEDDDKQYFEVDVDVSTSQAAGSVLKLVKGYAKGLEIDMHFLLEPQQQDELPEALWGGVRLMNIDLINIPVTYLPDDEV